MFETFWGRVGDILGPMFVHLGIILGHVGSIFVDLWVIWRRFGDMWGDMLGSMLGHFGSEV